jgi:predicted DNA-binding protein (MmcQ/YjbR family)
VRPRGNDDDATAQRERVVRECMKMPGAELTYPFGEETAVFKVGDKMFAVVSEDEDPGRLTMKCDPDYGAYLTQQFDDIVPGYHMNKRAHRKSTGCDRREQ